MPQIILEDVIKTYRAAVRPTGFFGALRGAFAREHTVVRALDGISFSLEAGELAGYIGPNGAGKSTTIKLMSGILVPDSGRVDVMGRTPWKRRAEHVSRIGVVFGQRSQLWWDTPVSDSFELLRDIYKVPRNEYAARLGELAEMLGAGALLKIPVRQLSLGQRMKCELIAALLHKPDVLFLDEPTIGLDAVTKLSLRAFLIGLNRRRGVTMILTTHDMDDIEALCSRVMVIGKGNLLFDGGMDALRGRYAPHRVLNARLAGNAGALNSLAGVDKVTIDGQAARVIFRPDVIPAEKVIADIASLCPIRDLTVEAPDIEEIVAGMYGEMSL